MYLAGGYVSMVCATNIGNNGKYNPVGFAVGPIFGVVVLLWQNNSLRSAVGTASLKFLLLSTLVWALVDWLLHVAPEDRYLDWIILVGSILLPLAHTWVFRSTWQRICLAIALSFAGFESWRLIADSAPDLVRRIVTAATLWQGGYLLAMYGPQRSRPRAAKI
jgi:hypothetical protein